MPLVNPSRRSLLLMGVVGVVGVSAGCDRDATVSQGESSSSSPTTPSPSPMRTCAAEARPRPVPELGVKIPHAIGCGAKPPRKFAKGQRDARPPGPMVLFEQFTAYLVPEGHVEQKRQIINGYHGYFGSADDLPQGSVLGWKDANIVYASQPYDEYTNKKTEYVDYYAFIRFDRPPRPGHPVLTLRWTQVTRGAGAPEWFLRNVATQITLL